MFLCKNIHVIFLQDNRVTFQKGQLKKFWSQKKDSVLLEKANEEPSFFHLVEKWLETYPYEVVSYDKFRAVFNTTMCNSFKKDYDILEVGNEKLYYFC